MRKRLIAQQAEGVLDEEPRRIQHHQHFGGERLCHGLPCLARDGLSDFRFLFEQPALKLAQHRNPAAHTDRNPRRLRRTRPRDCRLHFTFARAFQFAQNFTCRRIYRRNFALRDL